MAQAESLGGYQTTHEKIQIFYIKVW